MKSKDPFLSQQTSFATIATFFALWIAVYFDAVTEDYMGYLLIITIGILHGANDIRLIRRVFTTVLPGQMNPLIPYVGMVLLTGLAFYFIPALALMVFILLSCYHFGEQHWIDKSVKTAWPHKLFFLAYGSLIFGLLFFLNAEETLSIMENITAVDLHTDLLTLFFGIAVVSSIGLGIYLFLSRKMQSNWIEEIFLILVLALVFKMASLIWAFAIYFIFWHSIPSLNDQIKLLYGENNRLNLKKYLKSSWLYYIFAVVGLVTTLYLLRNQEQLFLSIFFSFLAAITLPHVLVMMRVYKEE
ncbi:MAG: beta-carotene 15,15'-dioxygenase, Brp/Blh family [Flavobacteriaceae bacterium]|nr:beta-carotene 15,15'-dioxygenase, Brp/Blh family [Flavobacteriaceae bacterium]